MAPVGALQDHLVERGHLGRNVWLGGERIPNRIWQCGHLCRAAARQPVIVYFARVGADARTCLGTARTRACRTSAVTDDREDQD